MVNIIKEINKSRDYAVVQILIMRNLMTPEQLEETQKQFSKYKQAQEEEQCS
jgi:hypothetical protein